MVVFSSRFSDATSLTIRFNVEDVGCAFEILHARKIFQHLFRGIEKDVGLIVEARRNSLAKDSVC